ncbi:MAG: thioredoxin domain-containing protein [Janthinobacterium lividum]
MSNHSSIPWREWGEEAFAEAKSQDKPILLDIGAVWCHWCHVMDTGIPGDPDHTGTYSDPQVQERILANFVPIKVDNDRRPDINARYNMGGWPTTAFLTPDGDTLYGETYVTPSRMVGLLDYMADMYANHKSEIAQQTAQMREQRAKSEALTPSDLDPDTTAHVLKSIAGQFDSVYGGFGSQPKFPHPDALRLVLEEYARTSDPKLREIAEKTLHGMADGGMYDQFAGGFFRYSTTRDWSIPHFEKMLEDNAKLTSVYALASQVLDDPYYLEVVKTAHNWLLTDMRDPETGAFAGSQDADAEEAYYGEPLSVRAALPTPFIDRTVYTGWNALMVSALVARYKITGEQDILEAVRKVFGQLYEHGETIWPGDNLAAWWHDENAKYPIGLLVDQSAIINAGLDFYEVSAEEIDEIGDGDGLPVSGLIVALMAANFVLAQLTDKNEGGFFDIAPNSNAIGELARPKKEISENAEAALALIRLSGFTEDAKYKQAAVRALKLFADKYADYGYFSSSYARAVEAANAPGLHITIVGEIDDEQTWGLQQAAWSFVAPAKMVETLSREEATKQGLPADKDGLAYATVCVGTLCHAPVTDAAAMRGLMENA